jgi:hypothetical protein
MWQIQDKILAVGYVALYCNTDSPIIPRPDVPKPCSAKHRQVLRKEIEKKNKINVTRSDMFFKVVWKWIFCFIYLRKYLTTLIFIIYPVDTKIIFEL